MKIFLQRVRQAGRSNSRSALFIIFATIFVLGAVLPPAASKQNSFSGGPIRQLISPKIPATPTYTFTSSTGNPIVPGTTDVGPHCDDCMGSIALPFTYKVYEFAFN